ncbi:Alpha/Beta hydrolase protein [Lentinula raphanica]|uniref:Alpha/Beta hydrolase protein n=1 Tax=Lentinula raphanica TaxID=153919 RepID=A0AA38UBG5_9AGAR|nr:Alpha/Beta hydrolase protein [Lentinula raphanica]KAJ3819057.1 Alpha/Beta hydrolase protein [Lentinula raphanica]KAJ3836324.1 Alpha/Beta hydrolase protein [Lentinula raphanica]
MLHSLSGISSLLTLLLLSTTCLSSQSQLQGTLHRRNYFYVGEQYVDEPGTHNGTEIAFGQIYVEHLVPATVTQTLPILMIHGHGMTGTNFLNTPDGRLGWADYFMSQGFEIYIVDQPSRGRSAWQMGIDGNESAYDATTISSHFTAVEKFNLWPQASLHTQWPGSGIAGDAIFDNFYASTVPSLNSDEESSVKVKRAVGKLLDDIGPVILLTHSQSGQYGWILGDFRPSLVKTIIALEPIGPPFINAVFPPLTPARPFGVTEIPVTYSPPISSASELKTEVVPSLTNASLGTTCFQQAAPARQMVNLKDIPTLVVTSESSYHAVYDSCTVGYLAQAGVPVTHVQLADVGIKGNAHMMFMEKNGLEIAEKVVLEWINKTVA